MDQIPLTGRLAINFWRSINHFGRTKVFAFSFECHFRQWTGCGFTQNLPKRKWTLPVGIDTQYAFEGIRNLALKLLWGMLLMYTVHTEDFCSIGTQQCREPHWGATGFEEIWHGCVVAVTPNCAYLSHLLPHAAQLKLILFLPNLSANNFWSPGSLVFPTTFHQSMEKHLRRAGIECRSSFSASDCLWRVNIWAR